MLLLIVITFSTHPSLSQTGNSPAQQQPPTQHIGDQSFSQLNKQYGKLTSIIHKQSAKLLKRLEKQEAKLYKQLQSKDSTKAKELFNDAQNNYQHLQAKLHSPPGKDIIHPLKEYIPDLDSLHTAMRFLEKASGLPTAKLQKITQVNEQLNTLQDKLQTANEIQNFIKQREQQLKETLGNMPGLSNPLKGLNQQVYYYQQRL
jgi:hypothetical protein